MGLGESYLRNHCRTTNMFNMRRDSNIAATLPYHMNHMMENGNDAASRQAARQQQQQQ